MRFSSVVSAFTVLCILLLPLTTVAAASASTAADFFGRRVYITGVWTVKTTPDAVDFTDASSSSRTLHLGKIPNNSCTYEAIRGKALKLWTGAVLQSNLRLQTLIIGHSHYRGYKWMEPAVGLPNQQHWCLAQDSKNSTEITAAVTDKALVKFVDTNLLLQVAVRKGL
jgi:hypothetical protein